jgi:hypothetical protein
MNQDLNILLDKGNAYFENKQINKGNAHSRKQIHIHGDIYIYIYIYILSCSGDERHGYSIWPGIAWWLSNLRPGLN